MGAQQFTGDWFSPLADKLSRQLIIDCEIQSGYGLAFFLEVNKMLDNFVAIRVWVQRMLDNNEVDPFDQLEELKKLLTQILPIS
ncbi:MAG: hypothetical protein NVSMB70_13830 [Chamaesiphon sp.]